MSRSTTTLHQPAVASLDWPAAIAATHVERVRSLPAEHRSRPARLAIQGAGGYGKSALLSALAARFADARIPIHEGVPTTSPEPGTVVLVDDAHRLDAESLDTLHALTRDTAIGIVVTYRPWPRSEPLRRLIDSLCQHHPPLPLRALRANELPSALTNRTASPEWTERLLAETGGVPRLLARALAGDRHRDDWPAPVVESFQHDIDQLGEPARRCLLALAIGAVAHPDVLAGLLDLSSAVVSEAFAEVRSSGLLSSDDSPLPLARRAVLALAPWDRQLPVLRRLLDTRIANGSPVLDLVRPLLASGAALTPEATLSSAFEHAAGEALPADPHLAIALLDAAVAGGVPSRDVTARRALAHALAGELDEALRLADAVMTDEGARDRTLGVQVAATALAHRGLLSRSAQLCRWSVRYARWPGDCAFAATGLMGTGEFDAAVELRASVPDPGPPTSLSGAAGQLADGVQESISGSASAALSTLVRAASLAESAPHTAPMPDTPAAVAAVAGLHAGEFDVAESVLRRALATGAGGPLHHRRHALLTAWLPLLRGDTVSASRKLQESYSDNVELPPRDGLLATALEAGIANRDNDTTALSRVRGRARDAVTQHPADLFSLLPLGELTVAMARFRDQDWLSPHLDRAWSLLDRLGNPPLWSAFLRWKCLYAAIVSEDMESAHRHADTLSSFASHNPMSAAMSGAAHVWLRVLDGHVVQDEVERAAHGLHTAGLSWDGARIAGQAAIRTTDRRAMTALLECARVLQGKPARPRKTAPTPRTSGESLPEQSAEDDGGLLSEREKEVAELVLAGMTYKQVGKRLFISAKTVEHHIGRVRQRLGCTTREELFDRLRSLVG